eukprot:Skav228224  [mRNA]  locus=scaffold43:318666:323307:- [translate_table: standard]
MLLMKIYRKLAFWRPRFKFMSAHDLTQTLYDKHIDKGEGDIFLDMKELVLNDQDGPKKSEERKEVFDNDFACFLDFLMLVNVSFTMITAPLTFLWDGRWGDTSSVPGGRDLLVLDLCLDLIYAIYLLLMLEMSYLHPERRTEIVTRRRVIRSRLRSPLYWLKWLSVTTYFWVVAFDAPLLINILKVIRGGVFIELPDSLWRLRDTSEVRLAKPILLLMGIAHWVASCLFSWGGYLEYMQTNGVEASETSFRGQTIDGRISSYVVAYVEALYMLTGALDGPTGDGARDGNFGALIIVVIFAPIGQLVDLKNALDRRHNENKAFIQRAVQILGIPKELQRRVFSMHYFQKMSHDIEAFQILFDGKNLSAALSSALKVYLYQESVLNCVYLAGKDPNYIIEVVKILEDVVCLPGEYVARRGEIAHQMFFIARGTLSILVPDVHHDADVQKARALPNKLKLSDNFGEVALVKDCVRTAWIRADTYALLASLSRHHIEVIWKYFPAYRQELADKVAETAKKDKQRNAQNRWKNMGIGDKKKQILQMKKDGEEDNAWKSNRLSVMAAADDEDNNNDILASGDSAALEVEKDGTTKMLSEVLQRQTSLEARREVAEKTPNDFFLHLNA